MRREGGWGEWGEIKEGGKDDPPPPPHPPRRRITKSLLTEMMQVFLLQTDALLFSLVVFHGDEKVKEEGKGYGAETKKGVRKTPPPPRMMTKSLLIELMQVFILRTDV